MMLRICTLAIFEWYRCYQSLSNGVIFIVMPDADKMRIQAYETVEDQLKEQETNS